MADDSYWRHRAVEEAKRANAAEAALRASEAELKEWRETDWATQLKKLSNDNSELLKARTVAQEAVRAREQRNQELQERMRVLESALERSQLLKNDCHCPATNDGLSPNYWVEHKPGCRFRPARPQEEK